MSGSSGWDDDDEKTVMGWLDQTPPGASQPTKKDAPATTGAPAAVPGAPPLPEAQRPPLPEAPRPPLPEAQRPPVPGAQDQPLPGAQNQPVPGGPMPSVPQAPMPSLPKASTPFVAGSEAPRNPFVSPAPARNPFAPPASTPPGPSPDAAASGALPPLRNPFVAPDNAQSPRNPFAAPTPSPAPAPSSQPAAQRPGSLPENLPENLPETLPAADVPAAPRNPFVAPGPAPGNPFAPPKGRSAAPLPEASAPGRVPPGPATGAPAFPPLPGAQPAPAPVDLPQVASPLGGGPAAAAPDTPPADTPAPVAAEKVREEIQTEDGRLDWFDEQTSPPVPRTPAMGTAAASTELDWFDDPTQPPSAFPPVASDSASPPAEGFALAAPRPPAAFQSYVPREAWTREEILDQALKGHGLSSTLRRVWRRSKGGLRSGTRLQFMREASQRLSHPQDAFLDDAALETFRGLVTTRIEELSLDTHDPMEDMPSGLSDREQHEWQALGKGLFQLLRKLERRAGDKPQIGKNSRLHDQLVRMGQDPYMGPPPADMARYDPTKKVPRVRAQFLGFFGPFGAFPLNWTEEIDHWFRHGDDSFVAFVDIFTERFQELYFRAWSDAHAITQFDHPSADRFKDFLLSFAGNGTPAMQDRDAVPDTIKARYAGLASGRVKSPVRLRQILQLHFDGKLTVRIEELVPTWLDFEPDTLSHIGMQSATMGMDTHLGSRVRSVGEKIRVHLEVKTIGDYFRLLPSGSYHPHLRDLVFWYLGEAYEIEVVLWLPEPEVQPAVMGQNAVVGWMACIAPPKGSPDVLVRATEFKLLPLKERDEKEAA